MAEARSGPQCSIQPLGCPCLELRNRNLVESYLPQGPVLSSPWQLDHSPLPDALCWTWVMMLALTDRSKHGHTGSLTISSPANSVVQVQVLRSNQTLCALKIDLKLRGQRVKKLQMTYLTDPTINGLPLGRFLVILRAIASASIGSPAAVPVPCAST